MYPAINRDHQFPYIVLDHQEIIANMKCIVMEDSVVQLKVMLVYCILQTVRGGRLVCNHKILLRRANHEYFILQLSSATENFYTLNNLQYVAIIN